MAIYYFNPHNDLALAASSPHFTPPASALSIEDAGAALPLWWASDRDILLVRTPAALAMARAVAQANRLPDIATLSLSGCDDIPAPWGWSAFTAEVYRSAGLPPSLIPSDSWIDLVRRLSHRRSAIEVLRHMDWHSHLMPVEAFTVEEAMNAYSRWHRAVMKLPWSGSGRGIMLAHEIPADTLRGYISGVIRRQGSIIVEPFYRRQLDFAMLFEIDKDVVYTGVSLFHADTRGRYCGNIVASQEHLLAMIGSDITPIRLRLTEALRSLADAGYRGVAGVDMMICKPPYPGGPSLVPCIEVNLRHTMGMVAARLAERGMRGILRYSAAASGTSLSGSGPCFSIE